MNSLTSLLTNSRNELLSKRDELAKTLYQHKRGTVAYKELVKQLNQMNAAVNWHNNVPKEFIYD